MNKKSNIIVGSAVIGLIGLGILGISLVPKVGKGNEAPVRVERSQTTESKEIVVQKHENASSSVSQNGSFVASKQGKKYFPTTCGSAKTIKEENRIYFSSEAEAETAGYERTQTCK